MKNFICPILILLAGCDVITEPVDNDGNVVKSTPATFEIKQLPVSLTETNEVRYYVNDGRIQITEWTSLANKTDSRNCVMATSTITHAVSISCR